MSIMTGMLDPAMIASLRGTLPPMGLLAASEEENARQAAVLRERTQAAQAAAGQAEQVYGQAAAAPPPAPDLLASVLPLLAGNISSILTQDKSYTQRASDNVKTQHDDLIRARMENLTALKATHDAKARAAAEAGNLEVELTSRAKSEQLAKTLQVLLEKQRDEAQTARDAQGHKDKLAEIAAQGAQTRQTQAAKPPEISDFDPQDYIEQTEGGRPYLNQSRIPQAKYRQLATDFARKQGVPVLTEKGRSAIDLVNAGRRNVASIREVLEGKLADTTNPLTRLAQGGKNVAAAGLQTDPELASYKAFRTAAVEAMQTIASLGVGFRINREEIRLAMRNDIPNLTDTQQVAHQKTERLLSMFQHIEDAVLQQSGGKKASSDFDLYRKGK